MQVAVDSLQRKARSEDYDRATRVEFAAAGWTNADGHAQFPVGELAMVLAIGGRPASASATSRAVKEARDRGAIGPESVARCLVVDSESVRQGRGQEGCYWHGVATNWR